MTSETDKEMSTLNNLSQKGVKKNFNELKLKLSSSFLVPGDRLSSSSKGVRYETFDFCLFF